MYLKERVCIMYICGFMTFLVSKLKHNYTSSHKTDLLNIYCPIRYLYQF